MATVIRLDRNALEFLFEKLGDDFVLELRAATLQEAIKRRIKTVTSHAFERTVETLIQDNVREAIAAYEPRRGLTLSDQVKELIRSRTTSEVYKAVDQRMATTDVDGIVKRHVESVMIYIKRRVYKAAMEQVREWANTEVARQLALVTEE